MSFNDSIPCSLGTPGCSCDATRETAWACSWCGKMHRITKSTPSPISAWCSDKCYAEHKTANPNAYHFTGWQAISDTLPGGSLDGIWEDSGLGISESEQ